MKNLRFVLYFVILFSMILPLSIMALDADVLEEAFNENLSFKRDVYESLRSFIESNPDYPRLDEMYFKIAEISADLYPNDPAQVLHYYRRVLEINPGFTAERDVVLYNIGYFANDLAKKLRDEGRRQYIQRRTESEVF